MDVVTLSRLQFAFTVAFHFIFPPLTIGLGVLLVIMEARWLRTRDALYRDMTRFWARVLGLIFVVGVASGIVLALADDREAAIPKAISWVLRAHTGRCPAEVAAFLEEHRADLPAIAVREARNKLATGYKAGKPPR